MNNLNYGTVTKRCIAVLVVFSLSAFIPDFTNHYEVTFIDVDQGDATLIRYKKTNVLIDTGGKKSMSIANECLIPFFKSKKITSLDAIIITHPDFDHNGALDELKLNFKVDSVFMFDDFFKNKDNSIYINDLYITNLNDM